MVRTPFADANAEIRKNLATDALVKIWGCNSAVKGWTYSDNGVIDATDTSEPYYWRALNEKNIPKPSIAQALADYLGVPAYGASSGAIIEVLHGAKWISTSEYKKREGH